MKIASTGTNKSAGFAWKGLGLAFLLAAVAASAQTQCPETNGVKFLLPPNIDSGWDVLDSRGVVVADDFRCTNSGAITDIHLWGSWLNDSTGTITNFWLGIYDDVPAGTGANPTPSHPGTNLLWHESFTPGQYALAPYGTGNEMFFDPSVTNIVGGDHVAWYYCFYPASPFKQQGTTAAPTNYWLVVYAQMADPTTRHGWKTSLQSYNDAAVWAFWSSALGKPVGPWTPMKNVTTGLPLDLAFKITTPTNNPEPCCPETNGVKWVMQPNIGGGVDLQDSQGFTLADDFLCTNSGAISDIHFWGSWNGDIVDPSPTFTLTIWSDVPVGGANNYSHPGIALWSQTFGPGQYSACPYATALEYFFSPSGLTPLGQSSNLFYYCFWPDAATAFHQGGSPNAPTNYWLSVSAQGTAGVGSTFGWKSSKDSYHDGAVWGSGSPVNGWNPISDPFSGSTIDLSFKITTATNNPPTCVEGPIKYVQWPAFFGGYDVWDSGPWILGDDFICTNAGLVTDIHLWGSWKSNFVDLNTTFWLGIYDDVAGSPGNPSHPGTLQWSQTFAPGQYVQTPIGTGQEMFIDPGNPQDITPEEQVWYYCFYPTNPFTQMGFAGAPKTYWLVAYAQPSQPTNSFGWKTTTNVQHDVSVYGPSLPLGTPPPANWPWQPTMLPTGAPLDLAFKVTTTNCPIVYTCSPDKRVECGTNWNFDPPIVGLSPCCPTLPTVTPLPPVTNGVCPQIATEIWVIQDCLGQTVTCTQNVTIVDTTAPSIVCPPTKTVECDSSWTFDPPTATDNCCTNPQIYPYDPIITNSPACPLVLIRRWIAYDCCGNTNICSQTVIVEDTNPPTIICPTNMVVKTCSNSVVVSWTVTAFDNCSSVSVSSAPSSPAVFLPNTTNTVTCTAVDACGNTNTCSFTIAVVRPVLGTLTITHPTATTIVLTWTDGILEGADDLTGPWMDVFGATSPYSTSIVGAKKFYRLRCNSP
jgi:hypothetical protein